MGFDIILKKFLITLNKLFLFLGNIFFKIIILFSNIFTNEHDVVNNEKNILNNKSNVVNNKLNILNNKSDVINDKLNISNNKSNVVNNKLNILNNKSNVVNNKLNIPNNKSNVVNNEKDNSDNKKENYIKMLFYEIKNSLFIENKENNEVFIFKQLQNKSSSHNKVSIDTDKSFQKHYLNKILNDNIDEIINIKLATPLTFIILAIFALIGYIFFGLEIAIVIILLFLMVGFSIFYLPKMKNEKNNSEISKELPYALRQMVTELRSGKGLYDTLSSIANSNYGYLSIEFSRVLEEIKYGESTEKALLNLSNRVSSEGLNRSIQQIIGTLKTGGNLANTLNIIAEDISYDLQLKLKDYSQKLNAFILIYTFLAILGPVIFLIMLMAASSIIGDIIPPNVILIIYIFFFPMIVIFMGLMIKRLEPSL
ncbi:bacterial type II secretion system protein F domain protein [Methanobrevibacter cuticularis]|uniref:Bacterial type II secretion system protein F domain protein n=1 Tax=Methanobrevibacter cuticularis TaxID=47311 RepID=A0A166DEP2_9EURY|nr:type II secretion system F family protein [Methanobrevibacter cuticularis]KZX15513.1 bacterial type II secretion system protein F domain protein [Methanobrevibacter cuticularis]